MLRTPLASISGNRPKGRDLHPHERGFLLGLSAGGATPSKIFKDYHVPKSTTRSTIALASQRVNQVTQPRTGRPNLLSVRDHRHLIRTARINPRIKYRELLEKTGLSCSKSTAYRALKAYGLTNWLAKKRPLLTPEVAALRLTWCKEREAWTKNQWLKVIWSDECSVERGTGKERAWVFRFPDEKWKKEMIQPYKKGKGVSIMVWAGFCGRDRTNLHRMTRDPAAPRGGYSASSYVEVLEENIPTIYEPGLLFMQDNAPIHTERKVREWFEEMGIDVLEWPPYSPDLNPIEHLWFRLKQLVYRVNPQIEQVKGDADTVRDALWAALEQAWHMIEEDILDDLVGSMQRRVQAVIKAEGWYTKY